MRSRRTFLHTTAVATLVTFRRQFSSRPTTGVSRVSAHHHPTHVVGGPGLSAFPRDEDPDLQAMAMRALDAARSAGASYADVRFTLTRQRTFANVDPAADSETFAMGVRALANGAWGVATTTDCTAERVAQLGRTAAEHAYTNAWPGVPPIELADRPSATTGAWQTPIVRDPFTVSTAEVTGLIQTAFNQMQHLKGEISLILAFERQDRTFASTEGDYLTQTIYTSLGGTPHSPLLPSHLIVTARASNGRLGAYQLPAISPIGAGYETVEALRILDHLPAWLDTARALAAATPFQALGEYDVVFDAYAMAALLDGTFGVALEYDRAVGYEANASGTSYLSPPATILGTSWAPTMVTLTVDRTLPAGAATVQWDDEGMAPRPVPLIQAGVVVDYATTREFAAELAPWYHRRGTPVRSNGCAASESALVPSVVHTPNLLLHPSQEPISFEALLSGIATGFAILGGTVEMDQQQRTGRGTGAQVYTIKHGKVGAPVTQAAYTFKSQDLWRNLVAIGGASTAAARGLTSSKGQPNQSTVHTVNAPAARFANVRLQSATQV